MSCKVEKFQSAGKGNGLRATVSVSAGEELYVAEPFAYTIKEELHGHVCEFCLIATGRLFRCLQCKYAKYCSKRCRAKAGPDHTRECNYLKRCPTTGIDAGRLVMKTLFKVLQNSHCPSENLYSVSDLECKPKMESGKLNEEYEDIAQMLLHCLKDEIPEPTQIPADLNLPELIAKVGCNQFPIYNGTLLDVAVGLYPSISLLNHSCEPNCSMAFMGRLLHLRAIRNIEAGEELTITYTDPIMSTEERQSKLRASYCFECDCRRCQTRELDAHMLAGDSYASEKTKSLAMMMDTLESKQLWGKMLKLCRFQLKENVGRVPDENIYQLKLLCSAADACSAVGRPKEGLRYARRALEPYRLYTSGINYARATLLIKISGMQMNTFQIGQTVYTVTEAYEIMKLFLGRNHSLTKELTQILR